MGRRNVTYRHRYVFLYNIAATQPLSKLPWDFWSSSSSSLSVLMVGCRAVSPEIRLPNRRISQSRGRETILECHITAHPHAVNYWHKHGRRIVSSARSLTHSLSRQHSTDIYTPSLILSSTDIDVTPTALPRPHALDTAAVAAGLGPTSAQLMT